MVTLALVKTNPETKPEFVDASLAANAQILAFPLPHPNVDPVLNMVDFASRPISNPVHGQAFIDFVDQKFQQADSIEDYYRATYNALHPFAVAKLRKYEIHHQAPVFHHDYIKAVGNNVLEFGERGVEQERAAGFFLDSIGNYIKLTRIDSALKTIAVGSLSAFLKSQAKPKEGVRSPSEIWRPKMAQTILDQMGVRRQKSFQHPGLRTA